MTVREATELDKAIERATEHGIIVLAQGRFKADNGKFFLTTSASTPDGVHVVRQHGVHLHCDCKARVICAHRAAVHMHLQVAAARRQAQSDAIQAALEAESAPKSDTKATKATATRKTSTQPVGWTAPLHRSNAAISIWK